MADFLSRLPKNLYVAADVRKLDSVAIESFNQPGLVLMQRAGAYALHCLLERWPHTQFIRIFAGAGNNAGDGFVIASLAKDQGIQCEVVTVGDVASLKGDAKSAFEIAEKGAVSFISLEDVEDKSKGMSLVNVDALLGTGLDRNPEGEYARAIAMLNNSKVPIVAIDVPSGLNSNTGMTMGVAVKCDLTTTFIGMKQGLLTGEGRDFCGEVLFNSLDIPDEVYSHENAPQVSARRIDITDTVSYLSPRSIASHKGSHGHVVIVGGDYSYGGAPILAGGAALRAGAGLVSIVTRTMHRSAVLARHPEIMVMATEDGGSADKESFSEASIQAIAGLISKADCVVIGPGLGRGAWSEELFNLSLAQCRAAKIPLVIDADALFFLSQRNQSSLNGQNQDFVITPHPGEAATLLACENSEIQKDRFAAVKKLAQRYQCASLLKGSGSLIADCDQPDVISLCSEGNAGMAVAGMGDTLSGIVAALIAQGFAKRNALEVACCIHGEAGDIARSLGGERGLMATDLLDPIRQLVNPKQIMSN